MHSALRCFRHIIAMLAVSLGVASSGWLHRKSSDASPSVIVTKIAPSSLCHSRARPVPYLIRDPELARSPTPWILLRLKDRNGMRWSDYFRSDMGNKYVIASPDAIGTRALTRFIIGETASLLSPRHQMQIVPKKSIALQNLSGALNYNHKCAYRNIML